MIRQLLLSSAFVSIALGAHATEYKGGADVGGEAATYDIVTDGMIGALATGDILAFTVSLATAGAPDVINQTSGFAAINGVDLTATAQSLSYNFGGTSGDYAAFDSHQAGAGYFAFQSSPNAFGFGTSGPGDAAFNGAAVYSDVRSGDPVVATAVSAAPEPATWALMIAGVGLVGGALRLGRRCPRAVAA